MQRCESKNVCFEALIYENLQGQPFAARDRKTFAPTSCFLLSPRISAASSVFRSLLFG